MKTKTPPLLKWLLVERATLAGDIARMGERQELLSQEIAASQARLVFLTREIPRLQHRTAQLIQARAEQQVRLSALDSTINLADSTVAPNAAGVVRATGGRYGGRGELKAFIVSTLRDAAPAALQTRMIARAATVQFGLDFSSQGEFLDFLRNSVRHQIAQLKEQGLVETVGIGGNGRSLGSWRWKNQLPTIAELTGLAAANG